MNKTWIYKDLIDIVVIFHRKSLVLDITSSTDPSEIQKELLEAIRKTVKNPPKYIPKQITEIKTPELQYLYNIKRVIRRLKQYRVIPKQSDDLASLLHINQILLNRVKPAWEIRIRRTDEPIDDEFDFLLKKLKPSDYENEDLYRILINTSAVGPFLKLSEWLLTPPLLHANLATLLLHFAVELSINFSISFDTALKYIPRIIKTLEEIPNNSEFTPTELSLLILKNITTYVPSLNQEVVIHFTQKLKDYSKRTKKILRLIYHTPYISRKEIAKKCRISPVTVFREIKRLEADNWLTVKKKGPKTYYELDQQAKLFLATQTDF